MLMAYLTLASGLLISAVAIFYSVAGLTSIFSAAVWPIIIMGTSLEVAKLVATVWLKQNWEIAPRFLKGYLLGAVIVLMFITSMGIFGFLSKAHSDQTLVSGDVGSKIAIYDEKIKTEKENIDAARKALAQMDASVDQTLSRSTSEQGADKATAIRRSQAKERANLQKEITTAQTNIAKLQEERAPFAADLRKVESEVGPIKYIAAFIYGDNPDANVLERAVTWVIILIVVVFDPLAVMLLLASQYTFGLKKKQEEPDDNTEPVATLADPTPVEDDVDLDYVNSLLAEAVEIPEPEIPEIEIHSTVDPIKKEYPHNILRDVDHEDADNDVIIITEPKVNKEPPKEIKILSESHLMINGDRVSFNDLNNGDESVKNAVELAQKLESTGEFVITHTPDGVILTDSQGNSSEHVLEERPGDYINEPTYIQNEEQRQSGVWQKIQHSITEEEYIQKSQEKLKGTE